MVDLVPPPEPSAPRPSTGCSTCDQLRAEMDAKSKSIARRRTLGAMLDLHLRSRHPELVAELRALDTRSPLW